MPLVELIRTYTKGLDSSVVVGAIHELPLLLVILRKSYL